jgi:hypothetical protein
LPLAYSALPIRPLAGLAEVEEPGLCSSEEGSGKNRIMIFDPKADGTYVIEFRTAKGEALAIFGAARRDRRLAALPSAHALRALRA